jgi:integrase
MGKKGTKKGEGSILFRKSQNSYYFRKQINGKIKEVKLKTADYETALKRADKHKNEFAAVYHAKTEAEIALQIAQAQQKKEATIAEDKEIGIHLLEVFDEFVTNPRRTTNPSKGTLQNYKRNYNRFLIWLHANYPAIEFLAEVNENIAVAYSKYLHTLHLAKSTYNYHIGGLKMIYEWAAPQSNNPWLSISLKKIKVVDKKRHKLFSKSEVNSILSVFDDDSFYLLNKDEMECVIKIGIYTGMRLADCINLKWNMINNGFIVFYPIKTIAHNVKAIVPINNKLKKMFNIVKQYDKSEYVLSTMQERYSRNPDGIKEDIYRLLRKAGVKKELKSNSRGELLETYRESEEIAGFHSFRHTFITECVNNGIDIVKLSEMVGDKIKTLQDYYIHLKKASLMKEIGKLPNY